MIENNEIVMKLKAHKCSERLEIVMNMVGCSECKSKGTFYRDILEEWNDIDREFVKEFIRRL